MDQAYWFDGLAFLGITGDGSQTYWRDGLPTKELVAAGGGGSPDPGLGSLSLLGIG